MSGYDKDTAESYALHRDVSGPRRKHMLYPSWLKACGDVSNKRILDVGCGDGVSSRLLADQGANVIGLDASQKQIELAGKKELENSQGINYLQADMADMPVFRPKFDLVTACLSIHYCSSYEMLEAVFKNISNNLKNEGKFVALNQNPDQPTEPGYKHGNAISEWNNERNKWEDGAEIEVQLLNSNGEKLTVFTNYYWSKETYEAVMKAAGFSDIQWTSLKMEPEGKQRIDNWKQLEDNCSLIILSAQK